MAPHLTLLDGPTKPTSLIIAVDGFGPSVYAALRERQISIPDEMALIGFAETGRGPTFHPPLTTLAITDFNLGQESAELLIALIGGDITPPVARVIEPKMIVRATSAPPRREG